MANFNSFNLGKEGVSVSVKSWQGELVSYEKLEDLWIKLTGIPLKWCEWIVLDQFASNYGLLEDVHGQGISSSFYEIMRMKIKCTIKLIGIPSKWCAWIVLDQYASNYGLLEDVHWQGIFSSFYEIMRMKIKCRDASKIPKERLFCIDKRLYKIAITIMESRVQAKGQKGDNKSEDKDKREDNDKGDDKDDKDEFNDIDDLEDDESQYE
jgi:hypothetical protein